MFAYNLKFQRYHATKNSLKNLENKKFEDRKFFFSSVCPFEKNYQQRKLERESAKIKEIFNADTQNLISHSANMDILVPNFFTSELSFQHYPWKQTSNRNLNFFQNSYGRFILPLSTNVRLREKLNRLFNKEVRTGRIFELMDSMAGIVSYSHCYAPLTTSIINRDMICVTGSVQSLHLFHKISINEDIIMQGYLNHVGNTSMEIEINVFQEGKIKANSLFTMIAREAANPLKGYQVPQLSFQNLSQSQKQKATLRAESAKININNRKREMLESYDISPPTPEQIKEIHQNFLSRKNKLNFQNATPISQTKIESCQIMHTQKRNIHGKIFGGFLIKEMIELAWVAGCKHSGDLVEMEELTNIYFKKPVDIGSRLTLKAMVTYVKQCKLVVTVQAYISNFKEKQEVLACYLHLIANSSQKTKIVYPETYEESLQYLSSRKVFKEVFY